MVFLNMVLLNPLRYSCIVSIEILKFHRKYIRRTLRSHAFNFINLFISINTDAAAGADLSSINSAEPIELTRAKQLITEYLTRWAEASN